MANRRTRLWQGILVVSFLGFCYSALAADGGAPAQQIPQNLQLAMLWPLVGVLLSTAQGYFIPRLAAAYSFFHTSLGAVALGVLGAVIGSVIPVFQAGTVTWVTLAWAAISGATAFFARLNPGSTKDDPPAKSPASKLGVVLPLLFLPLALSGCHGYKAPTYATLAVMAGGTGVAAQQMPAICEGQENAAVDGAKTKADALAVTAAIHHRCEMAIAGLDGVGKGLKAARDAVHDAPDDSAAAASVAPWIKSVVSTYCDLVPLLAEFKVSLPVPPGVC